MVYVKIHESIRKVVAICDSDIIGKKFEDEKRQLDVRESFFKDVEMGDEEAIRLMQREIGEDATFNIVGDKSVRLAREAGIVVEDNLGEVDGVPFALLLG